MPEPPPDQVDKKMATVGRIALILLAIAIACGALAAIMVQLVKV